jgi:hypothetical protein
LECQGRLHGCAIALFLLFGEAADPEKAQMGKYNKKGKIRKKQDILRMNEWKKMNV